MDNVLSFSAARTAGGDTRPVGAREADSAPRFVANSRADFIRAAGALAGICTTWSFLLVLTPSRDGALLLADTRDLVADLLHLGGVPPKDAEGRPPPNVDLVAARIREMTDKARAAGVAVGPFP